VSDLTSIDATLQAPVRPYAGLW